jgi:hypothetical protein
VWNEIQNASNRQESERQQVNQIAPLALRFQIKLLNPQAAHMGLNDKLSQRRASGSESRSGTEAAPRRWLSDLLGHVMSSIFWGKISVVKVNPVGSGVSRDLNVIVEPTVHTLVVIGNLVPS